MTTYETGMLRLGPLEAQVMDVLWDHGACTVRDVIERLEANPAYTTIATVLTNLDRKHLIEIVRDRRSTRYSARITRHAHAAQIMSHALDASRDREASILQFVGSMRESDLSLLREYLTQNDAGTHL
ncbi:BlaI/MecI/CopY family transcriptional regulator [Agrococcus casei]|uniref:Transcriptional regulator, MecI family n=1 Tax=Agrococcus casei LMG 22410 TaxID=1255656 RepID=A0A1R4EX18_9MICO|nr:BlaI/MecI/CopY family transcriptional regulator [Agrococcus casei]SJM48214.1 Transcriptional regulator, MecI family [Agrococcus casei LMG 22410]